MSDRLWVVIPAAGVGRRMAFIAADQRTPKQYLQLAGRSIIEWSMLPFLSRSDVAGVVVVLSPDDSRFATLPVAKDSRVQTTTGGADRADSVLRGLMALQASDRDWLLVHDAARPCLHADDLARLLSELSNHEVGGLLAAPVADTLKAADPSRHVESTVAREGMWRAFTPQMFRYGLLRRALQTAAEAHVAVTDEAAAVERLGSRPKLVMGRVDNIKITVPEDLAHAEFILRGRLQ